MIRRLRPGLATPVPAARLGLVHALIGGYTLQHLLCRRRLFRDMVRKRPELIAPVGPVQYGR